MLDLVLDARWSNVDFRSRPRPSSLPGGLEMVSSLTTSEVSIVVAVVSLTGTIGAAIVVAFSNYTTAASKRRSDAVATLNKYQDPFLLAALSLRRQLQSNLIETGLVYDPTRRSVVEDYIVIYTAYLVGQFFAWLYILRTESQFLSIERTHERIRALTDAIFDVEEAWSVESGGRFKLWRGQQCGIGDLLTVHTTISTDKGVSITTGHSCMGYPKFHDNWCNTAEFKHWFGDFAYNPRGGSERLAEVVGALDALIAVLDPKGDSMIAYSRVDEEQNFLMDLPKHSMQSTLMNEKMLQRTVQ